MLKNIGIYLKKLNNDFKKLQKYQDNITYGLDYLFNEEDYYKPTEVKSAFDGNNVLYESRGDKDGKLALYEHFDKIKPHLKDMIDYYKSKGEWKIQIAMRIIFISFIDKNKTQVMHIKSDNAEIMMVLILVMLLINLLITDGTSNWYYLAIKNLSGLLRGITSNHNGDFYCLNCLHSYRTISKLKKHEKYVKITIFAI